MRLQEALGARGVIDSPVVQARVDGIAPPEPLDQESLRRKAHSCGQPQGGVQSANYVDAIGPRKPRRATGHSRSIAIVPASPDFLARNQPGVGKRFPHGDNRP